MNDEPTMLGYLNACTCPDCKVGDWPFEEGPRGGLSQNIQCKACGSRFNVAPRYLDGRPYRLFVAEKIQNPWGNRGEQ